jgi:16S rRNA processing protein RimM
MNAGDLHIGSVVGVHGIKGHLKVVSFAETITPFSAGSTVAVQTGTGSVQEFTIREVRPHKNILRVALEGVETREDAENLVGARFVVDRADLPEPEAGSWYWCDLIGLAVYAGDACIGRVAGLFETGSNDVLVVADEESERLIPAIDSIVQKIDLENQIMQVELPEGL